MTVIGSRWPSEADFFYPHFCEISTIPSWAFDDIIFPSIRGSPLVLCGLGFSKGPVNILQWMSERASKPGRNRPSNLSSRDLYTAVSLITAAEEGKMVNSVAIFGMKWQRHDGNIFERFSKETEEGTVTDCTQASRLLPVEPSCPYGYPVC